jgi:hypothetical protein
MSNAAEMWIPGEPPKDEKPYLAWLARNQPPHKTPSEYRYPTLFPVILWWSSTTCSWEWEDSDPESSKVCGEILFHAEINSPEGEV